MDQRNTRLICGLICLFIALLCIPAGIHAGFMDSTPGGANLRRQGSDLKLLYNSIFSYEYYKSTRLPTLPLGEWFRVLATEDPSITQLTRFGQSTSGLPLDIYGRPLVYDGESIRSIGANGIDEYGKGDDWALIMLRPNDSDRSETWRYLPPLGTWHLADFLTARYRFVWLLAIGALVGLAANFFIRRLSPLQRVGLFGLPIGLAIAFVLPQGFDRGWGSSSVSVDPHWLEPTVGFGELAAIASFVLLVAPVALVVFRKKVRPKYLCVKCAYDLRGLSEDTKNCPECGARFRG